MYNSKEQFNVAENADESSKRIGGILKTLFFLSMFQLISGFLHIMSGTLMDVCTYYSDMTSIRVFPFSAHGQTWSGCLTIVAGFMGMYASRQMPLITNRCMKKWVFTHYIWSNIAMGQALMILGWSIAAITRCNSEIVCNTAATVTISMTIGTATLMAMMNITNFAYYMARRTSYGMTNNWCKAYD